MNVYRASSRLGVGQRVDIYYCRFPRHCSRSPRLELAELVDGASTRRSSSSSSNVDDDKELERKWTLLYHRNPSRNTSPRAFFGISTFNLFYWTWYVVDFTPAINSSAQSKFELGKINAETLEMLLIDPNMGYIGLGVSSIIWLGAFLYSRQLVSAIWATQHTESGGEEDSRLAVATLRLPFLTQPKILLKTVYDPESNNFDGAVEDIPFTESEITTSTPSVHIFAPGDLALCEDKIQHDAIVKYDGDFRKLRGHIALKKADGNDEKKGPLAALLDQKYLLDISSTEEVMPNASSTLGYHLFSRDYRLSSVRRGGRIGTKKSGIADGSVATERKGRRPRTVDLQRPVSQLEMARGILNESMKRKNGGK